MRNFTITNIVVFVFLFIAGHMDAQIVNKPTLGFTKACASPSFNSYNATFSFDSGLINASNQFILELSDETGDFSNPVILFTSAVGAITTTPHVITFSVPTTIAGEAFKVRIKSTSPASTSNSSDAFPAYYQIHDTPFTINNFNPTGVYCSGGSYLLTIDNPGTGDNDSPLQYPSLTFNWHKETSLTTSDIVAIGASLAVSEPGTYFVETNYGTCNPSNSFSNRVTVSQASLGGSSSISSSLGNPFCSSQGSTMLTATTGSTYQWFKDDNAIDGATNQTYETNQSGVYSVNVTLDSCSTSASITLDANQFTSSIDVSETPAVNLMPSSGSLTATLTSTAVNPEYEWYLNESLITGAISESYEATQIGNYKAVIKQTVGCISSKEFLFVIQEAFPDVPNIPNLISPNGDGINDTWVIPKAYISGTNTEIVLFSSQGEIVFQTNDYQNNWPVDELTFKDVNPVYYYIITTENQQTKKGSITVIK